MLQRLYLLLLPLLLITNLYSQDFECTDCHDDVPIKGVHQGIFKKEREYVIEVVEKFLKENV